MLLQLLIFRKQKEINGIATFQPRMLKVIPPRLRSNSDALTIRHQWTAAWAAPPVSILSSADCDCCTPPRQEEEYRRPEHRVEHVYRGLRVRRRGRAQVIGDFVRNCQKTH